MIKITWTFLLVCICLFAAVQLIKAFFPADKHGWVKYIPWILLCLTCIVYGFITKNIWDAILNGATVTAFACYFYDLIKPLIELIKKKK